VCVHRYMMTNSTGPSERHYLTGGFYRLGYNIGKKPRMTIGFTFLLTLLLALGMGFPGLKNESRGDKLW